MTRFAKAVRKTKRRFKYTPDVGRDRWRFPLFMRGLWWGDCEDFCFAVIRRLEGGKRKAIRAIERGKYIIWFCTTKGDGGKVNHAVVQCGDQYAEVIYAKATRKPNSEWGNLRLVRPLSGRFVLNRMGVIDTMDEGR